MTQCWLDDPAVRPSFSDICINIDQIIATAEHLPLPGQSSPPEQQHAAAVAGTPPNQPSPTYSNCTFDSDDDDAGAPLYRNCMNSSSLLGTSAVDE